MLFPRKFFSLLAEKSFKLKEKETKNNINLEEPGVD